MLLLFIVYCFVCVPVMVAPADRAVTLPEFPIRNSLWSAASV